MGVLSMQLARERLAALDAMRSVGGRRQLTDDVVRLRSAYGPNWPQVPRDFSERATQARDFLASGLLPVDVDVTSPDRVIKRAGEFVREVEKMSPRLRSSVDVLEELFRTELSTMPLGQLRTLCRATIRLGRAPAPNPCWAHPSEAHAAKVLLLVIGDDLRELSALRRQLYEEFSEDIWSLQCARKARPIERWWQLARRRRVRRELGLVTRPGVCPPDVKRAVAMLRRNNELHADIDKMGAAISHRLGPFADEGIPDIDGATEALAAMDAVVTTLGDRLEPDSLHALAAADAFICEEISVPATRVVLTVSAWTAKAMRAGADTPLAYSVVELEQWAVRAEQALDVLSQLTDATTWLGAGDHTVGEILEHAIMRDRVQELCGVGR